VATLCFLSCASPRQTPQPFPVGIIDLVLASYAASDSRQSLQIFIRNCENCKCIIACQQYRARECVDCDTLLFASTAPVVESSKNMRFGCFRFFYFNLAQQFKSVNMSVYDNKWSEVYDFTPTDGNFSFLPLDTKVRSATISACLQDIDRSLDYPRARLCARGPSCVSTCVCVRACLVCVLKGECRRQIW
jgi:hypothetical protein